MKELVDDETEKVFENIKFVTLKAVSRTKQETIEMEQPDAEKEKLVI